MSLRLILLSEVSAKVKHIFSIFVCRCGGAGNRILAIGCWGVQSSVYLGYLAVPYATVYRLQDIEFLEVTSRLCGPFRDTRCLVLMLAKWHLVLVNVLFCMG